MHIVSPPSRPERTASWIIGIIAVFGVCLSGCASWVDHHFKPTVDALQGVVVSALLLVSVTMVNNSQTGMP